MKNKDDIQSQTDKIFQKNSRKKALIIQGGYEPHNPRAVAEVLAALLVRENFEVEISDTLGILDDREKLMRVNLIVPVWTLGTLTPTQLRNLLDAVSGGAGLAGMHGGMVDAFRCEVEYMLMVGGQFVAHPGGAGITYEVRICSRDYPITAGIGNFVVTTEQYYMLVDPANVVLAATCFPRARFPEVWRPVSMPVVWIKQYGDGRVFFNALGHSLDIVTRPEVLKMMQRGMAWAAR
ncbi:ThuA domain-containing protein [Paenibacillus harenae]|uniref:ThuA domain-containing protein n=1 Tax=Paenibacillus harenae TaxID=306543 RepID=UPI00041C344F|nr:ThuA domain-containing protein [Paenibacillus harenae]